MNLLRFARLAALAPAFVASAALAQFAPPSPDQKDLPVDAPTRAAVVDSLVRALHERYVFPEVAKTLEREFRALQKRRAFDGLSSSEAFADSLTSVLRAVGKDRHFRVAYRERPLPVQGDGPPPAAELDRVRDLARRTNYGFERVARLPGNVGYLDVRSFQFAAPQAGEAIEAAMRFLANCDALIVDVRRNGGGEPSVVQLLCSYLFPEGERVHLNDLVIRDGGAEYVESYHTLPVVPGPRFGERDVYVLTSGLTASAAEEFAYNLQNRARATIVGDTTAGGANPGGFVRLSEHFAAFVSNGRARNPVSKTNWEGTGVRPDVATEAAAALTTAHVLAIEKLLERASDDERRGALRRALDAARATPPEPWEASRSKRVIP